MANGPPFYRLKMTKGTGQGLRASTVTPIDRVNSGGGSSGGGGGGLVVLDSGDLIYGDVPPGSAIKTLQFSVTGGTFGAARGVATGTDPGDWQVNSICGVAQSPPINLGTDDVVIGFTTGETCDVVLEFISSVPNVESSMTLTFTDSGGPEVAVLSATGTKTAPLRAAVQVQPSLLAYWTAKDRVLGDMTANSLVAAEDVFGSEPDFLFNATGVQSRVTIIDSDPPNTDPDLQKQIRSNGITFNLDFITASGISAVPKSGFVIFKVVSASMVSWWPVLNRVGGFGSGSNDPYMFLSVQNPRNPSMFSTPGQAIGGTLVQNQWYMFAWRHNGTGTELGGYISSLGGTWKDHGSSAAVRTITTTTELTMWDGSGGASGIAHCAAWGAFADDILESGLQTIFNSALA
jgi:hypothetical protein